ncbi:MAG: hypothetical protein IKR76_05560 [Ruminococcus sp.]|nr:hypothetical protein [Ruminococcus sp.]
MAINQELLNKLNTLAAEGKYKELAQFMIDTTAESTIKAEAHINGATDDLDTINSFMFTLGEVPPEQEIDPAKKAVAYGLTEALANIRDNALVETGKKYKEWKQRIDNGEVEEANLIGEEKVNDALAKDIALFGTQNGKDLYYAYNINGMLSSVLGGSNKKWQEEINKPEFNKYRNNVTNTVNTPVIKEVLDAHTEVSEEDKKLFFDIYGINPQASSGSYGIAVKPNFNMTDGKIEYKGLPAYITDINNAKTPEELDELKQKHLDIIDTEKEFEKTSKELATDILTDLTDIIDSGNNSIKNNDEYKNFKKSLRNLSKIGNGFNLNVGGKIFKTDDYKPLTIYNAVSEALELGEKYSAKINKMFDPNKAQTALAEHEEFVSDTLKDLEAYKKKMEVYKDKLSPAASTSAIRDANKHIGRIDKAAKSRGFDEERMQKAHLCTMFGRDIDKLDSCIGQSNKANQNVHFGGNDYDEAIEAMRQLSAASKAYRETMRNGGLKEENREAAEALRQQAMEARAKINKYVERKNIDKKKHKGKLDEKGERRFNAMEASMRSVNKLMYSLDDQLRTLDNELVREGQKAIVDGIKANMDTEKNRLMTEAGNEQSLGKKTAAMGAADALDTISELANGKGKLTPDEELSAKKALVKLGFYKMGLADKKRMWIDGRDPQFSADTYNKYVHDTACSQKYSDAIGELSRESLLLLVSEPEMKKIGDTLVNYVSDMAVERALKENERLTTADHGKNIITNVLDPVIKNANDPDADRYDEVPVSMTVQAAQTAKKGVEMLIDILENNGELTADDEEYVRDAYAALAFQSSKLSDSKDKIGHEEYVEQIHKLATDEDFVKTVGKLSMDGICKFMWDEKAPQKLMDSYLANKTRAMEEGAQKLNEKAKVKQQPEMGNNIQPKAL